MEKKVKTDPNIRLTAELLEMARDMHSIGVMDDAAYQKITLRHLDDFAVAAVAAPIEPGEIRSLRERAHMSQAVFARNLNLSPGYVSQLERGVKLPTGAALALLNVIRRKGIEVVL